MVDFVREKLIGDGAEAADRFSEILSEIEMMMSRMDSYERFYQRGMPYAEALEHDRNLLARLQHGAAMFEDGYAPPALERLISHGRQLRTSESRKRWLKRSAQVIHAILRTLEEDDPEGSAVGDRALNAAPRNVILLYREEEMLGGIVATLLRKARLTPVLARSQMEEDSASFIRNAAQREAAFAVMILSPDEIAAAKGRDSDVRDIGLELGFLIGRFGRSRMRILTIGDAPLPANLEEEFAIPVDGEGAWRDKLRKALAQAGCDIGGADGNQATEARA